MGIPLPGETILVLAAIYAAGDPAFNIWVVIGAAAVGSIMGDNLGYWIGKRYAYALLVRYGRHIGMSVPRIKLGQYLFREHGGMVVFVGRFIALLRILAAYLAGVNRMRWRNFLIANAAGAILWAVTFGFGGYFFGKLLFGVGYVIHRYEDRLIAKAERTAGRRDCARADTAIVRQNGRPARSPFWPNMGAGSEHRRNILRP
jgi:membrane protein DedA with SNARE-associated domain